MKLIEKPDLVIFHANCSDGFGAKYACMKKWGTTPLYIPQQHTKEMTIDDIKFDYKDKNILFTDFAFDNKEIMHEIRSQAKSIFIIDHHLTAIENLKDFNDVAYFDINKAACRLTWESLFPDMEIPLILKYVEDRDLRSWKLPYTEEVLSVLDTLPKDVISWDAFNQSLENSFEEIISKGENIKLLFNSYLQTMLLQKKDIQIAGYKGAIVNTSWEFSAYAADLLADKYDFGLAWFLNNEGLVKCSFRSKNGVNVKKIAALFGGGGHADNAGCTISLRELENIIKGNNKLTFIPPTNKDVALKMLTNQQIKKITEAKNFKNKI